jgi:hypothetical protein
VCETEKKLGARLRRSSYIVGASTPKNPPDHHHPMTARCRRPAKAGRIPRPKRLSIT